MEAPVQPKPRTRRTSATASGDVTRIADLESRREALRARLAQLEEASRRGTAVGSKADLTEAQADLLRELAATRLADEELEQAIEKLMAEGRAAIAAGLRAEAAAMLPELVAATETLDRLLTRWSELARKHQSVEPMGAFVGSPRPGLASAVRLTLADWRRAGIIRRR